MAIECGPGTPIDFLRLFKERVMLKISMNDTRRQRKLVLEGKLVPPWIAELNRAWNRAGEGLDGRRLVIDLNDVTLISREGENALLVMMKEGARFSGGGVFTRHVLKQLALRCRTGTDRTSEMRDAFIEQPDHIRNQGKRA
jgi:hypothetical protein